MMFHTLLLTKYSKIYRKWRMAPAFVRTSLASFFCIFICQFVVANESNGSEVDSSGTATSNSKAPKIEKALEPNIPDDFQDWLAELEKEAIKKGISESTAKTLLADLAYMPRVIASDRAQAEFKESYAEYLKKRVSEWRIEKGQKLKEELQPSMEPVTQSFGIPSRVVLAILGIETNYGTFKLPHTALNVLATLAYDSRRGDRFRKEVFAVMEMVEKKYASTDQLTSSWAGALGEPQFMPSTYLQFAVDYDKDGRRNIWEKGPDLYASVANYLSHYGWNSRQTWARKVILPKDRISQLVADTENKATPPKACKRYHKHLKGWKNLVQWDSAGVRRMNGTQLPVRSDMAASLIVTDEKAGHGYLVYGNFCTIMRYNPSFKYALSVGTLSDYLK